MGQYQQDISTRDLSIKVLPLLPKSKVVQYL